MYVRALAVVTMVVLVPLAIVSGIVPWLAPDVRRAGQQVLLLALTKRDWVDVHTAVTMGAILVATTHVVVVRTGLVADVRLLLTGQRSAPRPVRRAASWGGRTTSGPVVRHRASITLAGDADDVASGRPWAAASVGQHSVTLCRIGLGMFPPGQSP